MKVYLAGPINSCTDKEAKAWREKAKVLFPDYLDPMRNDYRGMELEPGNADIIVNTDKADIDACDAVLVWFEKPSVGTSMEVFYAYTKNKPVCVINRSKNPLSPWLIHHASHIVDSLEDAKKIFG
jgi:nucleoside 2-deoxyribosyltransferase